MDAKVLLCDFAEVSAGKLFITGAGISLIASSSPAEPFRVNVCLAVLVSIPWHQTEDEHRLTIELVSEASGAAQRIALTDQLPEGTSPEEQGMIVVTFRAVRSPIMVPGDESSMPIAIPLFGLPLPRQGPYFFSVRIDQQEMDRASFRLVPLPEAQAAAGE